MSPKKKERKPGPEPLRPEEKKSTLLQVWVNEEIALGIKFWVNYEKKKTKKRYLRTDFLNEAIEHELLRRKMESDIPFPYSFDMFMVSNKRYQDRNNELMEENRKLKESYHKLNKQLGNQLT